MEFEHDRQKPDTIPAESSFGVTRVGFAVVS